MIEEQLNALCLALFGEHLQYIFFIGSTINDIIIRNFAVEHREAIVVFAGDGDVFHAGVLHHLHPFFSIELSRIEERWKFFVGLRWNLLNLHHPFAIAKLAVNAPVNK